MTNPVYDVCLKAERDWPAGSGALALLPRSYRGGWLELPACQLPTGSCP
jgi:hypothetical protein